MRAPIFWGQLRDTVHTGERVECWVITQRKDGRDTLQEWCVPVRVGLREITEREAVRLWKYFQHNAGHYLADENWRIHKAFRLKPVPRDLFPEEFIPL